MLMMGIELYRSLLREEATQLLYPVYVAASS